MLCATPVPGGLRHGGYDVSSDGSTSTTGPFWAGLIALADQEAGHPLGFVNPAIYRIARGSPSLTPAPAKLPHTCQPICPSPVSASGDINVL
jgi:hypothetical protein